MRKRTVLIMSILLLLITLVSCKKKPKEETIEINVNNPSIVLKIGEKEQIDYDTNDSEGLNFESSDEDIVIVSNDGLVEGVSAGKAKINITSIKDENVKEEVNIEVLDSDTEELRFAEGMKLNLDLPKNATFEIGNSYVANIDEDGVLHAELEGRTTIKIFVDGILEKVYDIKVEGAIETIEIEGPTNMYLNDLEKVEHKVRPRTGFLDATYIVEDDSILSVDEEGNIFPLKPGTTTIKVVSLQSDEITDELELTILPTLVVSNKSEVKLGNHTFKKDVDMFDSLSDALDETLENTKIILEDYKLKDDITITKDVILDGINSQIVSELKLETKSVSINNLTFENSAKITSNEDLEEFTFKNNIVKDLEDTLFNLETYNSINISNNVFKDINGAAINLNQINNNSQTLIEKNEINNSLKGILIETNERLKINSYINIYRNKIDNVEEGFYLDLNNENKETNALIYARFNEVTNYDLAINSVDESKFEFTFNYWGDSTLNLEKFVNVDEMYLLGHYENKDDILSESRYRPNDPIIVDIENIIDVIELGETFKVEPIVLPYTADRSNVIIDVDNRNILNLTRTWDLEPVRTGVVNLTLSSFSAPENKNVYEIEVTTDPGIHFKLDNQTHNLEKGSKFKIEANPYPYNLVNEKVTFKSSNDDIAIVDNNGNVEITGVGEFIITASMNGEAVVDEELEFTSYEFEENNVMDFITQKQLTYSNVHEITLYGTEIADVVHNESVTRVLLTDYPIHREHEWFLDEINPNFRPGHKFNDQLPEEFKFNDDNAVWVVVHDTGNSAAGAGANLHARYLYNQANSPDGRQASWHYTVDAYESYMHLPENEVAWHAGDGSALPKLENESPALGGGNRNGIAIEMSIQKDGHIFKTWQNTAKLVGDLLYRYNLPTSHQTYHNDFSGKECPQTLRKAGLVDFFEELVENEYEMRTKYQEQISSIEFISHNEEIMNNDGTIIKVPNKSTQVSYTVNVELVDGTTQSRTFTTLIEGFYR